MAYQALYRKYRPSSFDEVVGQKHIVKTLKNAIATNRIAHAYLFCGPRGTGKTSIAKIFARTLNCTGENPPCMECENCRLSLTGSHPDIIEIDAASNNGVDEVRNLIDKVGYAPMEGKYKVYIIDEVHMMTSGAFNALLKTIEEPPAHVIFIFATTEPHKVLPTILSRCQRYDFGKVSHADLEARLNQICQAENIQADPEAVSLIADMADGGMRDALSILDQCAAYDQQCVTEESVREIYGVLQPSEFSEVMNHLNPQEAEQIIDFLERLEARGMDMKRFTSDLISLLKDSLLYEMAPHTPLIKENRKEVLEQSFRPVPSAKRISLLNDLMDIYNKFAFASNPMDYIETVLLKSALWSDSVPYRNSYEKIGSGQNDLPRPSEKPKLKSDSIEKKPDQSPESDLARMFWSSDVSRETSQNENIEKSEFRFSEDFLLSLLAGANKEYKSKDLSHLNDLGNYMNSLEYGKLARSMKDAQIYASGPNYILASLPDEKSALLVNDLQDSQGFESFTSQWLNQTKKVFGISKQESKNLTKAFVDRRKNGTLPQPAEIVLSESDLNSDLSVEEQLKQRFPDLIVKED